MALWGVSGLYKSWGLAAVMEKVGESMLVWAEPTVASEGGDEGGSKAYWVSIGEEA